MLYQLGALLLKVAPFNVDKVAHSGKTDFVPKPVLGAEPPMEWVGEGPNTWRLSGTLFPKVIGGLNELDLLEQMRKDGNPQYLFRGDGRPLGWVVIETINDTSEYLASDGVGQKIRVDIRVRKTGKPSRLS